MLNITSKIKLSNGVEMPRFGLGVWRVKDEREMDGAVRTAVEAGYIHFDTAAQYGNEDMIGRALKQYAKRDKIWVTTKLWGDRHDDAEKGLEESLKRLDMDYVDLYLIHWPQPEKDLYVKAWKTMIKLMQDGRARAIGVSNFKSGHIRRIIDETGVVPMVNQVERHPMFQQDELAEYCRGLGINMEAYSPLCSGHLKDIVGKIEPIAKKHGKTPAQVIIRWQMQSNWIVIPKSVTPSRIRENADVFDFELDEEDMTAMKNIDCGTKFLPDSDDFVPRRR